MPEVKHTPGPWDLYSRLHDGYTVQLDVVRNHQTIAGVHIRGHLPFEANARLIAAAPELLEALQTIESCLAPEDNDYAAQKVRAAIAKATGQAEKVSA